MSEGRFSCALTALIFVLVVLVFVALVSVVIGDWQGLLLAAVGIVLVAQVRRGVLRQWRAPDEPTKPQRSETQRWLIGIAGAWLLLPLLLITGTSLAWAVGLPALTTLTSVVLLFVRRRRAG